MNPLTEKLRPYVSQLEKDLKSGCIKASLVVQLYQMYIDCPNDPGAPALCEEAFEDWRKND